MGMAALAFTACNSNDVENPSGPIAAQITAGVSSPKTRALNNTWEANDKIGVRVTGVSGTTKSVTNQMESMYQNVLYSLSETVKHDEIAIFTSDNGIFFQDANEIVTFAAYGPYQTSADIATLPGEDGVISNKSTSKQSTRDLQKAFDFIYASGATASRSNPTVSFTAGQPFKHVMSRLVIIVKAGADITTDEVKAATSAYTLGGLILSGTFNVTTGEAVADDTATATADWSLSDNSLQDASGDLTFTSILYPQTLTSALTFKATIGGQKYSNTTSIKPALAAGTSYTYTITVNKTGVDISGSTIDDWTEGTSSSGYAEM